MADVNWKNEAVIGGYDIGGAKVSNQHGELSSADIAALKCSMCSHLLKEPRQVITCGHRYCQQCIDQLTSGDKVPYQCLVDGERFSKTEVRNDKGCLRDILTLEVTCPSKLPCLWTGKLTEIQAHRDACPNVELECDLGCGKQLKRGDLDTHKADCPKRLSKCQHCNEDIPLDSLQAHYGVCEEYPVSCDFCRKNIESRKKLLEHLEQDCDEYHMDCVHDGCSFKGRKSEMVQHVLAKHLLQSLERMTGVEQKLKTLENENKTLRGELTVCQTTVMELQTQTKKLVVENKQKDVDIASLKNIVEQLQKERDERDLALIPSGNFGDLLEKDGVVPKVNGPYRDVVTRKLRPSNLPDLGDGKKMAKYRALEVEEPVLKCLNPHVREPVFSVTGVPDVVRPEAEMSRVKQEVEMMQAKVRKLNDIVTTSQENQTRYGVAIDEIRLRQDVLDVKTTNGILIWKIPDIRRRFRDAVDRRTISLYSPPFYTSPHGYRMCIRTYLNGDGIGKGTHISLFFVVMRSEQDNLLPWPFKQSVRFTLINQKNQAASITEAFVPDLNSPSFQKPENDMNIASGFPKFARQGILHDEAFTMGNMIYIKCQVDMSGLSAH